MSQAINSQAATSALDAFNALLGAGEFTVTDRNTAARAAQGDTLEEARAKCIANIEANIAAVNGGPAVAASKLLYKRVNDQSTSIGVKYGNAWVVCMPKTAGGYGKFITCAPAAVLDKLEALKTLIAAGHADHALQKLRESNQDAAETRRRNKQ
jgi:hypothetical protein